MGAVGQPMPTAVLDLYQNRTHCHRDWRMSHSCHHFATSIHVTIPFCIVNHIVYFGLIGHRQVLSYVLKAAAVLLCFCNCLGLC